MALGMCVCVCVYLPDSEKDVEYFQQSVSLVRSLAQYMSRKLHVTQFVLGGDLNVELPADIPEVTGEL